MKKKYRVWVKSTEYLYVDVEAENEQEALKIGGDTDGGDFVADELSYTWDVVSAEEIK